MLSTQKLSTSTASKLGASISNKPFIKPAPIPMPTQKVSVGGVAVSVPAQYAETSAPVTGRMAAPSGGGASEFIADTGAEQFTAPVTEQSGFSWTWILVGVVVVVALFLVFKKR
jgi:hypothetical protein